MINYKTIGKQIKIERIKQDLTQQEVAKAAEISMPHYSDIERGETKPSFQTLLNIANVLHVSMDYILCYEADNPKSHGFATNEIMRELADCTRTELTLFHELIAVTKRNLRTLYKTEE